MRILVACPTLGISSEVWILRQIQGFARSGNSLSAVCWRQEGCCPQEHTRVPVDVLPHGLHPSVGWRRWPDRIKNLPGRNFARGTPAEERALRAVLQGRRPDVVLCHFGHVALRVMPVARRLGIPVVAHFHGADLSSKMSNRWYRWAVEHLAPQFEQVVVVGSHQARLVREMGAEDGRLNLIPCGVPTAQFDPRPRPVRQRVRFVLVSRIVPWKGIEQSIRAFAKLREDRTAASLVVIGEGEQRDSMVQLARELGVDGAIEFTGALPPEQVVQQLQDSDVFLQHSLTYSTGWCEGFGVSIAEAAAMALPLVVTRSGGIPDQVIDGQTGFLVPERDIEAMAQAMRRLVDSPVLREQMGQAGRARMIDHFDAVGQVNKLEQVLARAAGPGSVEALGRPLLVRDQPGGSLR